MNIIFSLFLGTRMSQRLDVTQWR